MSLKALHIVFVCASTLLAFGFGVWSLVQFANEGQRIDLAFGVGSILSGVALIIYGRLILKKLRHISYL